MSGGLPKDWEKTTQKYINELQANPAKIATRKASQNTLNAYGPMLPELLGGSADLAPSNLTIWKGSVSLKEDPAGNYIHYGVREFGMTAIANGIAHHGGFVPYTATFLMFVEYARKRRADGGTDESAADYGLYPRLNWPGRRWSDAPGC